VPPFLIAGVVVAGVVVLGATLVVASGEVVSPEEQLIARIETIKIKASAKITNLGRNFIVFIFLSLNVVPPESMCLSQKSIRQYPRIYHPLYDYMIQLE
jgi:hypothetical protein